MASLEDFDFEGLGQKLTQTVLNSFDEAASKISFSTIGSNLTAAIQNVNIQQALSDPLSKGIIKLTADTKITQAMSVVQKKLEDGFSQIVFKAGAIELPNIPAQTVEVVAKSAGGVEPKTATQTKGVSIDTAPFEKVGNLVKDFVDLTQEANKKTKVTSELYTKIVSIAEKLVETKRMEKDAVDEVISSLQKKMDIPPAKITAEITSVDSSKIAEAASGQVDVEAKVGKVSGGDFSSIEKAMTVLIGKLGKQLQSLFKTFDNKKLNIAIPPTDRLDDYKISYDTISSAVDELKTEVGELSNLELFLSVYSKDTYDIVQKRVAVENLLVGKKREELDVAAQVIGLANTASLSESQLKALIESKLVSLHKEVELRGLIVNATESYNTAIQQLDLGKLTAEITSQLGLIEDEISAKATVLALENERITGVRMLTAEQMQLLKTEDQELNKKREILNTDQALLTLNKSIVETSRKVDLSIQTQQLANQLTLLSEEAKLKTELLLQQKILNGEAAELTNAEKQSIIFLDLQVASSKKLADALVKVGDGQNELNNLVEQLDYDKKVAQLSIQKNLTEATVIAQARSIIAAKIAAGEEGKLTDEEATQLQLLNKQIVKDQEILTLKQKIIEATVSVSNSIQESTALASVMESGLYTQLGLTQDITREKAQAIVLDGLRNGLTQDEINKSLQVLKTEDSTLQKTLERIQASKDLESAADAYAKAVRQADADLSIKGLIVSLRLTEDEVAQQARLIALKNQEADVVDNLAKQAGVTVDEIKKQIQANNGLTNTQVAQLKLDNQILRHKREHVEIIEHVAEYQREVNDELEKYSMGWKKVKATAKAIFTDPALAKGIIFGSALEGIHALTHSMHEFKDVGMGAGEAVSATMRSLSLASLVGLSKSADVTKTLAQEFGNLNALTDDQIDSVGKMAANNGLAGEEATNLVMAMSRMPGMTRETAANSEKMFKEIGKAKGVIPAQIMKEVAKNSGLMATYSKGGAEGFAKAAASAKRMGVELSSVLSAAEKTLDFESSMNAQMEASVLLGKEINMEKLQEAALLGDANAVIREQQNLIRQAGGLENMNLLQKQKLAEVMGLSVEEMQKMNDEAQFQNEHFGEQAGLWSNITGYALKYGEAVMNGVQQFGPVIASVISLASNMMMLNAIKATSTGATTADTGATIANTGAKITNTATVGANSVVHSASAAARGVDTLAINANTTASRLNDMQMKAYQAMRATSIPATQAMAAARAMDTSATTANTGATTANTTAGGFWNTIRGLSNTIMNSSIVLWAREKAAMVINTAAKYASAAATGAWNIAKGAFITLMNSSIVLWIREKASIALSTTAQYASAVGQAAWNTAKAFGNMLMGTSVGMWIAEKAQIVLSTAAKWLNVGANSAVASSAGIAASATATSGTAAAGASGGFAAFGAALGAFGTAAAPAVPVILAIGAAILLATPALYVLGEVVKVLGTVIGNVLMKALEMLPSIIKAVADGFVTVFSTLAANWQILIPVALGIGALSFGFGALSLSLLALGAAGLYAAPGLLIVSMVMLSVGAGIAMMGSGIKSASDGVVNLVKNLQQIKPVLSNLDALAKALDNVGDSMSRLSKIGLIALPLLMIAGMSPASPKEAEGPTTTTAATPITPTQPATTTAITPAPAAKIGSAQNTPTAAPTAGTTTQQTAPTAQVDLTPLTAKIDELIAVMRAGGTINMDGKKVADIVQRNIRTVKYAD